MLVRFMVRQAAEELRPLMGKSGSSVSRAGVTLTFDNSVIDRLGKLLRCTWSWYSGRCKKVVRGNDLMGIVMTISGIAFPPHLLFCSKQGRGSTDKASLLIAMLTRLKDEFAREGIDLTAFPLTSDSWFASEKLKQRLLALGFKKIVIAGKGNHTFTIGKRRHNASSWKKTLRLIGDQWGIDVPSLRTEAFSPTFGRVVLFFFQKSATRTYYLMDFSPAPLRGAEIWRIRKQHHIIECFWKILKSVLGIKSMRLRGDGLYTALLIKVIAYMLAIRPGMRRPFLKMSVTEIMRKIRRESDLEDILREYFNLPISPA
ncbi:transposase [Desulfobacterales bacterium HSG2]|nr:transposase [Desulfobacterales bacterium HSG2]